MPRHRTRARRPGRRASGRTARDRARHRPVVHLPGGARPGDSDCRTGPGPGPAFEPVPGDDRQATAAHAIAGHDQLVLLVGPAGPARPPPSPAPSSDLRAQGRPVLGLAPSGKAADVLADETGCQAVTLAKLLTVHRDTPRSPIPAGTTVVLDEAGMAATDDLADLVHLADRHRWRLVMVGDPAQLPAVGRGGVFAHWTNTLPHYELTDPQRFAEPWEAKASLDLRRGDPTAAATYDEHRRLHTAHPALIATRVARSHERHVEPATRSPSPPPAPHRARDQPGHPSHPAPTGPERVPRRRQPGAGRRPDRHPPQRPRPPNRPARIGTEPPHLDRHRHRPDGGLVASDLRARSRCTACRLRRPARRARLGRHRLRQPRRHRRYRHRRPRTGTTRNHAYVALTRGRLSNDAWLPDPTGTTDPETQLAGIIRHGTTTHPALSERDRLHREAGHDPPDRRRQPAASIRSTSTRSRRSPLASTASNIAASNRRPVARALNRNRWSTAERAGATMVLARRRRTSAIPPVTGRVSAVVEVDERWPSRSCRAELGKPPIGTLAAVNASSTTAHGPRPTGGSPTSRTN